MSAVFITGGTTGIGMELARHYLAKGWKVGVCGRDRQKFHASFQGLEDKVLFYEVDVTEREKLKAAIAEFSRPTGLDLVIANAGIGFKQKTKVPDWQYSYRMVEINFVGVMHTFEAAMDVMIPQGRGHLVAISSLAAFNGLPGVAAYSATKAAVIKLCESFSLDLKKFNIDVTTICPGFIATPLTAHHTHPMPFLMSAPKAVEKIAWAIEKKKALYAFPFFFSYVVRFMGMLPRGFYRRIMTVKMFNYSKE